ncbi:hypothetical protein QBC35DRAFT_384498 [Podospora australis]|uniref:BTB domain-containing protein n=1 Tax=Podospora australis TaxID=1536484 RepID=A0AAN7AGD2_9PEZI|nr:hypothetical protein QBC35DRAFT_384498 [Podospora australis]
MVSSHHGDGPTALAVRGSSSVVGTGGERGSRDGGGHRTAGSHVSSRSRRYNRSHAGGSAFIPQNEFPVFSHSGDVEIVVRVATGHENRYLLHRHTLTRCSGFFEASTSNEWSRAQNVPELPAPGTAGAIEAPKPIANGDQRQLARIDGDADLNDNKLSTAANTLSLGPVKKRWRYELDYGSGNDDIPMLVQKEEERSHGPPPTINNSIFGGPAPPSSTSSSNRHHHSSNHGSDRKSGSHSFFRSVANLSLSSNHHHDRHHDRHHHHPLAQPALPPPTPAEQDLLRDYDNLFRIMYNYPPNLDGINIADAYIQCKSLLTLADQYDALPVVGPRVDHHLLQFQSRLWKQIAKYPISYLRLGYLARSKVIFQEALVHVVGQWPAGERSIRAALPENVVDIIEDKVDELEETVSRIEARLFRLTLTNRAGERVAPSTNYLDWLAVSLFRQWLAENTTPPPPLPSPVIPERTSRAGRDGHGGGVLSSRSQQRHPSSSSSSSSSSAAGGQLTTTRGHSHSVSFAGSTPIVPPLASLGRTYRILGAAPGLGSDKGYLSHDECKRFLKLTPDLYSRDNLRRFEKRVDELKGMAREVVRPLMGTGLELEMSGHGLGGGGIGYLTCTTLLDRDFPWVGYD